MATETKERTLCDSCENYFEVIECMLAAHGIPCEGWQEDEEE